MVSRSAKAAREPAAGAGGRTRRRSKAEGSIKCAARGEPAKDSIDRPSWPCRPGNQTAAKNERVKKNGENGILIKPGSVTGLKADCEATRRNRDVQPVPGRRNLRREGNRRYRRLAMRGRT